MRLKPDGQDLGLDLRKRGGDAGTPYIKYLLERESHKSGYISVTGDMKC